MAQALGTLLGGVMLIVVAKLAGLLGGVNWGQVGKTAGIVTAIALAYAVLSLLRLVFHEIEDEATRRVRKATQDWLARRRGDDSE